MPLQSYLSLSRPLAAFIQPSVVLRCLLTTPLVLDTVSPSSRPPPASPAVHAAASAGGAIIIVYERFVVGEEYFASVVVVLEGL